MAATDAGIVVGERAGDTIAFLGIPYATPPVGALRWRPPEPPQPWQSPLQVTRFPPPCLQAERKAGGTSGSEDCLYLNVWTPASRGSSTPLPVMVFVHGGGNVRGSTSLVRKGVHIYDGAKLAARGDVVVVTLQYRLGPFGYLSLPQLDAESQRHTSGNWALLDQILALHWVRDNITAFDGDPRRVLLFGESGGATDVCALLASPLAAGLFHSAIIESGGCTAKPKARIVAWSEAVTRGVDCSSVRDPLACLRGRDGAAILRAADLSTIVEGDVVTKVGPTIDGYVLRDHPLKVFAQGDYTGVPVIVGVNAQETSSPTFGIPWRLTPEQYRTLVGQRFPSTSRQVLDLYPETAFASPHDALVAVTTDHQFVCPARLYARALTRGQREPVYRYLFAHAMAGRAKVLGAAHGFELLYLFQHVEDFPDYTPTPQDAEIERLALQLWTSMARTGRPAAGGLPALPAYDANTDPYLVIDAPSSIATGLRARKCDFWDTTYGVSPKLGG